MKNPKRILMRLDRHNPELDADNDYNMTFIVRRLRLYGDMILHRGYMYMNQIYEDFGMEWNIEQENHCVTRDAIFHNRYKVRIIRVKSRIYGFEYYIDIRRKDS